MRIAIVILLIILSGNVKAHELRLTFELGMSLEHFIELIGKSAFKTVKFQENGYSLFNAKNVSIEDPLSKMKAFEESPGKLDLVFHDGKLSLIDIYSLPEDFLSFNSAIGKCKEHEKTASSLGFVDFDDKYRKSGDEISIKFERAMDKPFELLGFNMVSMQLNNIKLLCGINRKSGNQNFYSNGSEQIYEVKLALYFASPK